jgi:hypothetical protein
MKGYPGVVDRLYVLAARDRNIHAATREKVADRQGASLAGGTSLWKTPLVRTARLMGQLGLVVLPLMTPYKSRKCKATDWMACGDSSP